MPKEERDAWLATMSEAEVKILMYSWEFWARPKQRFPAGDWKRWVITCGRGYGKGYQENTLIPTPNGFTSIKELRIGDTVFDETGSQCAVTGIYPQGERDIYKFTFSDSTCLYADDSHLWVTWTHSERKAFLRSRFVVDKSRFPENWPQWRVEFTNCGGRKINQERLENALSAVAAGCSLREAERKYGAARVTVGKAVKGLLGKTKVPAISSNGPQVRSTLDIFKTLTYGKRKDTNHCIPVCGALVTTEFNLVTDPYLLGYWLGDGSVHTGAIAVGEEDRHHITGVCTEQGYKVSHGSGKIYVSGLLQRLRVDGVLDWKRIPKGWLRASIEQRLALLQGLMDTDGGGVDRDELCGGVEFTNTNKSIAYGVVELARSLGQKPRIEKYESYLYGVQKKDKYRVTWRPTIQVFRLQRKQQLILPLDGKQSLRNHHRMIVNVELAGRDRSVCIAVDSPNHMFLAGEGMIPTHNSRTGAEWVRHKIESGEYRHMALVAANAKDLRRVIVEDVRGGGSGLLQICPPYNCPTYSPTKMRLTWDNPNFKSYGASCSLYSAEDPDSLRGPAHDGAWLDEFAKFPRAIECWDQLQFGLRIGTNPQVVITTTPKPSPIFIKLLQMPGTVITTGSTFENKINLSSSFIQDILESYEGTRLGRQELYAEILSDVPGALWNMRLIEDAYLQKNANIPPLRSCVVGVDPQMSYISGSLTGIVVAGYASSVMGRPTQGYVLADRSVSGSPKEWAKAVVSAYRDYECAWVIAERNQGGELVADNIHNIDRNVRVKLVTATKSKGERAVPVVALYEQNRIFHIGSFPEMETEMLTFCPGDEHKKRSPNRVDACVWALNFLLINGMRRAAGLAIRQRI